MKTFDVMIQGVITVEANNKEEAVLMAQDLIEDRDLEFTAEEN